MSIDWNQTAGGIEVAIAESAAEFVDALRPSNPHWWEDGSCPWVFRGHAREEWSLLPSAWRSDNTIVENCLIEASRRFMQRLLPNRLIGFGIRISGPAQLPLVPTTRSLRGS